MKKTLLSTLLLTLVSVVMFAADAESIYVQKVDFESGVLPEGWTQEFVSSDIFGEHPWVIEKAAESDYPKADKSNGEYLLALRNNSNATIGYTTRLISPVMDLSQNKVFQPILAFSHAQQQRTGDFDQLKVYYRSKATDNWVRLDGRNGNPEFNQKIAKWQRDTIQLTSQSETYQVMFEVTDRFGRGVVLDNIEVRPMPTCEDPYNFDVSGLTSTSAVISWNASFDTDSFEVALSTSAIESMESFSLNDIAYYGFLNDDEFSFSTEKLNLTLKRNQTYYLYVRSYCQGSKSEWSYTSFRTKNIANLPLVQNFTAGEEFEYKTGTLNHISYWSFGTSIKRDDGITMEYMPFVNTNTQPGSSTANYAFDQSFCLVFTGARSVSTDIPAGQFVYAATPELNVENLKDVFVSFWGTAYQSVGDNYASGIIIGVMTDPEDFTTFVPVDTCYITESRMYNKFGVSLANYQGDAKYVAFASDFKEKNNRFYIDNILVKASNTPIWPSNIIATKQTPSSFELSLDSHGFDYNVVITKHIKDNKGQVLTEPSTNAEDVLLTLTAQKAQQQVITLPEGIGGQFIEVYVQAVNANGAGDWALPVKVLLPKHVSNAQMPLLIDFESTDVWQPNMLSEFSNAYSNSTQYPFDVAMTPAEYVEAGTKKYTWPSVQSSSSTLPDYNKGKKACWFYKQYQVETSVGFGYDWKWNHGTYFALPEVDDVKNVVLSFHMADYNNYELSYVVVGVMTDPYDVSTFDTIAGYSATSSSYKKFVQTFTDYTGNGKYIAIMTADNPSGKTRSAGSGSSSAGYSYQQYYTSMQVLDGIMLEAVGECIPAGAAKITTSDTKADITWGRSNMSQWVVKLTDAKDNQLAELTVDTNYYEAKNLLPHTTYKVYIASACDANGGQWTEFSTDCAPSEKVPFVEDFESAEYKTGSSNKFIPYCWSAPMYKYNGGNSGETDSFYPYIYRSTTSTTTGHNSASSLAMYTNTSSTTQNQMWVALPVLEKAIKELQVEFFVKGYSASQNSMFMVGVMTDPDDISTFEVVDSVNVVGSSTWKGAVVKFNNYAGEGKHIAFKRNYERDGKSCHYYLDDVVVSTISDCEKLFDLATSAPTTNGATFTWKNTGADKYEVIVLKEKINPNKDDTTGKYVSIEETNKNTLVYSNGNLALNTTYYVAVRSICGENKTTWSDLATFKTTCMPQTAADMGTITFSPPNSIGCWSVGVMNGTTNAPSASGNTTGKFGYYLYIFNTTASDGAYAIMPPLDVDDINKYQITFDVLSNSTIATNVKRITVGIISNAADLSTFAPLTVVNAPYATDSTGAMCVTIPFDNYDGDFVTGAKGTQVMFLSESGDSTNYIQIDNIHFEKIPACAAPSTVVADSVGTYGAQISWNNTGDAYDLVITSTKVAPDQEGAKIVKELKNLTDTVATVDGLEMLTTYYMFVRTICDAENTSDWSNARSFTTVCPESYKLPFAEDFEKSANTGASYKPDCWTYYYKNGNTITEGKTASYPTISGSSYSHSSKYCMQLWSSGATTKTYSFAATPYIENDLTKAMISFWYRANAYAAATPSRKLVVGVSEEVSTLDTLMATLTVLDTIIQTNTSSTIPYEKYTRIISEKYNGKGHYIVLISTDGNGSTSTGGMYVDDIEVSLVPTCFVPDNLKAEKMYDTSAQISWEQLQGDNKNWDVAYGLTGTALAELTIVPADTNVFVINGLQPSTTYDFYVRANCGDGDMSDWRGPVTASTLYQINLADAKWTFENGEKWKAQAPTGTNRIPESWFVNNVHTGLNTVGNAPYITYNSKNATTGLVTSRKAYSGDSAMYFYSGTTSGLDGYGPYAVLPVIKDESYDNLQVRFMARVTYSNTASKVDGSDSLMYTTYSYAGGSYKRTIYIGVASDPYDMSTFEEMTAYVLPTLGTSSTNVDINKVPDSEGTNYWREVVVPLYGAKGKYIVLAGCGNYNTVFVDDVTVEKVDPNACANVTKLALNEETLAYNKAEFSWLSPKSSFNVSVTEKGKAEPFAQTTVNTASFSIDTLEAQTTYVFSVQAVCAEDATSKAVTIEFTTPCKPADKENASWNFVDNLYQFGTSNTYVIPECWESGLGTGTGGQTYMPYSIANTTTYAYAYGDSVKGRALRFYTTTSNYNAYVVLPALDFKLDSMTLHFWGRAAYFYGSWYTGAAKGRLYTANNNYNRTLIVGTIKDAADFSTFTPIDTITYDQKWSSTTNVLYTNDDVNNRYWQEYALPLAKYAGKGRIAIVAPQPTATSYFWIDDVEVVEGNFCTPITGQRAVEVKATSAIISWTEQVIAPNAHIQVATNDEFDEKSIIFNDTIENTNIVNLTDLKPATTYYFRLKHICDAEAGDESDWSNTSSFLTDYIVRFNENFNSVNTTMPKNWNRSISTAAADVFSGEKTLSEASETASYAWRTSASGNQYIYANTTTNNASSSTSYQYHWLITPEIDLSANAEDSLLLSFDIALRSQASNMPNPNEGLKEEFMVIVSPDQGATWKQENAIIWSTDSIGKSNFNNFYANGAFLTKYIDLTKYAGQTVKIAFYLGSFADKQIAGSKNFVLLDNIQLNTYKLVENYDKICRWEDYSGYNFELDANQLPAGLNFFERFQPAKKDATDDLIERLTIEVEDESVTNLEEIVLCEGDTYNDNNFSFIATQSGTYKQKLQSAIGCDSTVILPVHVNMKKYVDIVETICQGAYYEFKDVKYYTSTNKTETFESVEGCDSIVTLHLTVNDILKGEPEEVYLCPGQTYAFTDKYPALSAEGEYVDTVINARGCDSIASIKIVSVPEEYTYIRGAICQGQVYDEGLFAGLSKAGDYATPHGEQGLKTAYGCDSIVTLHLMVAQPGDNQTYEIYDTIAADQLPYVLNGTELLPAGTSEGVYTRTITLGCGEANVVITVGNASGIDDIFANSLAVTPNPVTVGQDVRVLGKFSNAEVEVITATGAVVYTKQYTNEQITIPGLPAAGIYLVRLTDSKGEYHAKLVVK